MRSSSSNYILYFSLIYSHLVFGISTNVHCVEGCQEALDGFSWNGTDPSDYYGIRCTNPDTVKSMWACASVYCRKSQIEPGYNIYNGYCTEYGNVTLLPSSIIDSLTTTDIENLRQVSLKDLQEFLTLDEIVIPDENLFNLGFKTVNIFKYETSTDKLYGFAMYIFWAIVVAFGLAGRAVSYFAANLKPENDPESNSITFKSSFIERISYLIKRHMTMATLFGRQVQKASTWYTLPLRIQSLTILSFVFINVILCCVNFKAFQNNLYWPNIPSQLWRYIADRTAIICVSNLPLVWLFGSRNNFLLWVTGWNFATYNSFHRWVARVATVQAFVHAVAYSVIESSFDEYKASWKEQYWYAGALAVISMSLISGFSMYKIRKNFYEIFLYSHIALSIIFLVNLWFHIKIMDGEYNYYYWPCVAIWSFDRAARLIRLIIGNTNFWNLEATVTYSPESDIIRLKVPRSSKLTFGKYGSYYYLYVFNGVKFWESHPFTLSTCTTGSTDFNSSPATTEIQYSIMPEEKCAGSDNLTPVVSPDLKSQSLSNLSFLIRPYSSFTRRLRDSALSNDLRSSKLRVLIEGPYGGKLSLCRFDHVAFLIGGSGITVALSSVASAIAIPASSPSAHLMWVVPQYSFVKDVCDRELRYVETSSNVKVDAYITRSNSSQTDDIELSIEGVTIYRRRPLIRDLVLDISTGQGSKLLTGKTALVVSGPKEMVDEAREALLEAMGLDPRAQKIQFIEESFTW